MALSTMPMRTLSTVNTMKNMYVRKYTSANGVTPMPPMNASGKFSSVSSTTSVTIAVPKNTNAKNEHWKGTAPVIGSAPQKVALYRKEKKVPKECRQMDNRITYFFADYSFLEDELRDCDFCVHCTGQLDMEGAPGAFLGAWEAPPPPGMLAQGQVAPPEAPRAPPGAEGERPQKRARTASCVLDELKDLAALRAQGALNPAEYEEMKQRLLRGP